jgi:hypothetical protein
VDIVSKKMTGSPFIQVGVGLGTNSNVAKLDKFYLKMGLVLWFQKNKCLSNPLLPYNYSNSWDRQERKTLK